MVKLANVNILTPNGTTYLTACPGPGTGGLGGGIGPTPAGGPWNEGPPLSQNGLATNATAVGQNETFKLVFRNPAEGTFALQTADGSYVTVVDGGGMGGLIDPENRFPLHTDQTNPGPLETFNVTVGFKNTSIRGNNWTVSIQCPNGQFVTAVPVAAGQPGGGIGDGGANVTPIHTDGTGLIYWDGFQISEVFAYTFISFTFSSGNDELSGGVNGRGASSLQATFNLSDGSNFVLDPVNVYAQGQLIPFPGWSTVTCILNAPIPLTSDSIQSIELTLQQPPNRWPAGTDQWNLEQLQVSLLQHAPAPADVNRPDNPSFQLINAANVDGWIFTEANPNKVWKCS